MHFAVYKGKKRGDYDDGKEKVREAMHMDRSEAGTKEKRSHDCLNYPNQNTIIINIIC